MADEVMTAKLHYAAVGRGGCEEGEMKMLRGSEMLSVLREEILRRAQELADARLRPNEGWNNKIKYDADHRFCMALNEYAAALAAQADPEVWRDSVSEARRMMTEG